MNISRDCPWLVRRTQHRHHHHQRQSIIIIIILVVAIIARRWPGPIRTPSTREEIPNGTRSSHPPWPQITSQTASFYAYNPHPCVRLISSSSSSSFPTHPAICVPYLSCILDACVDCSFDSVNHFATEPRIPSIYFIIRERKLRNHSFQEFYSD